MVPCIARVGKIVGKVNSAIFRIKRPHKKGERI
nr:MAG TPA: hypothetical protein [Caudoviricetes sp.]